MIIDNTVAFTGSHSQPLPNVTNWNICPAAVPAELGHWIYLLSNHQQLNFFHYMSVRETHAMWTLYTHHWTSFGGVKADEQIAFKLPNASDFHWLNLRFAPSSRTTRSHPAGLFFCQRNIKEHLSECGGVEIKPRRQYWISTCWLRFAPIDGAKHPYSSLVIMWKKSIQLFWRTKCSTSNRDSDVQQGFGPFIGPHLQNCRTNNSFYCFPATSQSELLC